MIKSIRAVFSVDLISTTHFDVFKIKTIFFCIICNKAHFDQNTIQLYYFQFYKFNFPLFNQLTNNFYLIFRQNTILIFNFTLGIHP